VRKLAGEYGIGRGSTSIFSGRWLYGSRLLLCFLCERSDALRKPCRFEKSIPAIPGFGQTEVGDRTIVLLSPPKEASTAKH
jgi:hypothetical protein